MEAAANRDDEEFNPQEAPRVMIPGLASLTQTRCQAVGCNVLVSKPPKRLRGCGIMSLISMPQVSGSLPATPLCQNGNVPASRQAKRRTRPPERLKTMEENQSNSLLQHMKQFTEELLGLCL